MTVYVTIGEQNLSCEVRRGDRVSDLQTALHQQQPSLHVNQMQYTYKDTPLKRDEYLKEYGIKARRSKLHHSDLHCNTVSSHSAWVSTYQTGWREGSGGDAIAGRQ